MDLFVIVVMVQKLNTSYSLCDTFTFLSLNICNTQLIDASTLETEEKSERNRGDISSKLCFFVVYWSFYKTVYVDKLFCIIVVYCAGCNVKNETVIVC